MSGGDVDYRLRQDFLGQQADLSFYPGCLWKDNNAPLLDWIVDGCFIRGTVALLSSDGGLGKSLLMQQLCTAAAIGRDWLGFRTQHLKTYALFCEDDVDAIERRQNDINRYYGITMPDLEQNVMYRCRPGQFNILAEFAKWTAEPALTPLFNVMMMTCRKIGAQIIVLDTASDVFGGNEIAKDQVRAFITVLRRMAIILGAVVILTAHVSNEGLSSGSGLSGSRAWSNSVRTRLWLTEKQKEAGGDVRYLKTMKANYGPRGGPVRLVWRDGVFVREEEERRPARDFSEPTFEWPG